MKAPLVLVAGLTLMACGKTVKATAEEMRARACEGDVAGFFEHVDRDAVLTQAGAPSVPRILSLWEDELKHGPQGDFCRLGVGVVQEKDGRASVQMRLPDGRGARWLFTRYGKRWVMTGLQ